MPFWYIAKFVVDTYGSEACLVSIVIICELDKNWSLFLVTYKDGVYILGLKWEAI